jgi:hypothetical protein
MALTEMQIRGLKPKDKRYMIRDDNGLYLEVMISGNKHSNFAPQKVVLCHEKSMTSGNK